MSFELKFTPTAIKDIEDLKKSGDWLIPKRLLLLFEELAEHPRRGTGHPEELKYQYAGYWSRGINLKHRFVYSINDETVTVIVVQAKGHY